MSSKDEWKRILDRLDQMEAEDKRRGKLFDDCKKELIPEIFLFIFNHYTECVGREKLYEKEIGEEIERMIQNDIFESFIYLLFPEGEELEHPFMCTTAPKQLPTWEEAQRYLDQKLKPRFPKDYHPVLEENHKKDFEKELRHAIFEDNLRKLILRVVTKHFQENIMNLDAVGLRRVNHHVNAPLSWFHDKIITLIFQKEREERRKYLDEHIKEKHQKKMRRKL